MTEQPKGVQRSCRSDHQFLLCRTDQKIRQGVPDDAMPDTPAALLETFTDMATGKSFVDRAVESVVGISEFNALIVRLDKGDIPGSMTDDTHLVSLAESIQRVCQPKNGVWGWLGQDSFGCILPGTDATEATALAENIQDDLKQHAAGSATIGIARFPTLDYPKERILNNARKALDHAAFFGPGSVVCFDAVSLNISGDQQYQDGNIKEAIAEFEKALQLDASNVNVHNSLGVCFGVLGDFEKAVAAFDTAARLDPSEVMAVYNLGLIGKMAENDDEKALDYFMKAYHLGDEVFEVAFQAGKLYLDMDNPVRGKAFLEKATRIRPTSAIAHRYLGDCYTALDMTARAASNYKKAVKLNPNDADALSALGALMDALGENPEVSAVFCEHSVEIAPENGLFRHRLGSLYLNRGHLEQALKAFQKARDLGFDALPDIEKTKELLNAGIDDTA